MSLHTVRSRGTTEIELCADSLYLELTGMSAEEVFPGLRTGS